MGLKELLVKADRDDELNPGKKLPIGKYRDADGQLRNAVDTINEAGRPGKIEGNTAAGGGGGATSAVDAVKEFDKTEQQVAVCFSQWRKKHGGEKPETKSAGNKMSILASVEFDFKGD